MWTFPTPLAYLNAPEWSGRILVPDFEWNTTTGSTRSNQADNPAIMDGSSVNAPGPFQAVARERMGGSVIELVGKSRTRGRGSSRASTVVYGLPRTGFVVCC